MVGYKIGLRQKCAHTFTAPVGTPMSIGVKPVGPSLPRLAELACGMGFAVDGQWFIKTSRAVGDGTRAYSDGSWVLDLSMMRWDRISYDARVAPHMGTTLYTPMDNQRLADIPVGNGFFFAEEPYIKTQPHILWQAAADDVWGVHLRTWEWTRFVPTWVGQEMSLEISLMPLTWHAIADSRKQAAELNCS